MFVAWLIVVLAVSANACEIQIGTHTFVFNIQGSIVDQLTVKQNNLFGILVAKCGIGWEIEPAVRWPSNYVNIQMSCKITGYKSTSGDLIDNKEFGLTYVAAPSEQDNTKKFEQPDITIEVVYPSVMTEFQHAIFEHDLLQRYQVTDFSCRPREFTLFEPFSIGYTRFGIPQPDATYARTLTVHQAKEYGVTPTQLSDAIRGYFLDQKIIENATVLRIIYSCNTFSQRELNGKDIIENISSSDANALMICKNIALCSQNMTDCE